MKSIPHEVFISYSSNDKVTADAVCATLESRGIRCWIAPRDVLPGEEYASALVHALRDSQLMVLIFSSGANKSQQVLREVERAVSKGIPIVPLRIENIAPSAAMEYYISSRHWLDALTAPLEGHLVQLGETVQLLLSRAPGAQAAAPPTEAVKPVPAGAGRHNEAGGTELQTAEEAPHTPSTASSATARSSTLVEVLPSSPGVDRAPHVGPAASSDLGRKLAAQRQGVGGRPSAESHPSESAISNILGLAARLRAKDLPLVIGVAFSLVAAGLVGGWGVRGSLRPVTVEGVESAHPVEATKQFQDALRKRSSIQAFEDFLRAAQGKHWSEAYAFLGPSWKEGSDAVTKPDDLARIYRRTIRHEFNYYLPTLVSDTREEYNADLTFWDMVPVLSARNALTSSRISAVLLPAQVNAIADELTRELPNDYAVPKEKQSQLSALVRDLIAQMTLQDIVLRDDLVELLGKNFGFEPIVTHNNSQGARSGTPKERFFKVVLVKQQGRWLVDSYDSFLVEKK
jgi:TIR domain